MLSQLGDGWFQAALAGSVLFNPERAASPIAIAAAFAVLLLPYSVVGPFVGVFLDRWSRRTALVIANLARAVAVLPAAVSVWYGREDVIFLGAALIAVALNRFFLSGLSASQPHVVEPDRLVTANSFATTAGTVVYTGSLGCAGVVIQLIGPDRTTYAGVATVATVALPRVGGPDVRRASGPEALGPDDADRLDQVNHRRPCATRRVGMVAGLPPPRRSAGRGASRAGDPGRASRALRRAGDDDAAAVPQLLLH